MTEESRINLFLHSENTRIFGINEPQHLPIIIISGFLGSGKTTLLKELLLNKQNLKIAAAINDFGEINIDSELIQVTKKAAKTINLANGCICCSVLNDLTTTVWNLIQENDATQNYDYIVIETSGVTDPKNIIASLDASFGKMYRARLDNVICMIDCDSWDDSTVASQNQIKYADTIILNKIDLLVNNKKEAVHDDDFSSNSSNTNNNNNNDGDVKTKLDELKNKIYKYTTNRKGIQILEASYGKVPVKQLLDVFDGHDDQKRQKTDDGVSHEKIDIPYYVNKIPTGWHRNINEEDDDDHHHDDDDNHHHDHSKHDTDKNHLQQDQFITCSIVNNTKPILIENFINFVATIPLNTLKRSKGILWLCESDYNEDDRSSSSGSSSSNNSNSACNIQLYRATFHMSGRSPGRWSFQLENKWNSAPESKLVFIGRTSDNNNDNTTTLSFLNDTNKMKYDLFDKKNKIIIKHEEEEEEEQSSKSSVLKNVYDKIIQTFLSSSQQTEEENDGDGGTTNKNIFTIYHNENTNVLYIRLNASIYQYKNDMDVQRNTRIKMDQVNEMFLNLINSSLDIPKIFIPSCYLDLNELKGEKLAITLLCGGSSSSRSSDKGTEDDDDTLKFVLCIPLNIFIDDQNMMNVNDVKLNYWYHTLKREGHTALKIAFKNVKVCKCD